MRNLLGLAALVAVLVTPLRAQEDFAPIVAAMPFGDALLLIHDGGNSTLIQIGELVITDPTPNRWGLPRGVAARPTGGSIETSWTDRLGYNRMVYMSWPNYLTDAEETVMLDLHDARIQALEAVFPQ